jgi:Protein of unknown function (DUF3667)
MHTCLNCGELLSARRPPKFCPACGQDTRVKPPSLREFAQQFGGAYLATEGALWRTLKLLLAKPGELTAQYLAGRRRHYVLPLRLYLTISLMVLLAFRLAAHLQPDIDNEPARDPQATRSAQINVPGFGSAGLHRGVFFCKDFPAWMCQRLQRRFDVDKTALARELGQVKERFVANTGAALFVLMPGFAWLLKGVYWRRRMLFTEHLVFALHVHALWLLAALLLLTESLWLILPTLVLVPAYTLLAMRRVYGGRWWPRLLRAGLVFNLYLFMFLLVLTVLLLWTLAV